MFFFRSTRNFFAINASKMCSLALSSAKPGRRKILAPSLKLQLSLYSVECQTFYWTVDYESGRHLQRRVMLSEASPRFAFIARDKSYTGRCQLPRRRRNPSKQIVTDILCLPRCHETFACWNKLTWPVATAFWNITYGLIHMLVASITVNWRERHHNSSSCVVPSSSSLLYWAFPLALAEQIWTVYVNYGLMTTTILLNK